MLSNISFLLFSYLLSAVPFGLLLGFICYKKDVRKEGSGNIGATNVFRTCGRFAGISTFLLDGIKGAVPVLLSKQLAFPSYFTYLVAITCIVGHIFPIYLKFKGGKGVATTILVLFALNLKIGLIAVLIWALFLVLFGFVSIASIAMSIILIPFSFLTVNDGYKMLIFNIVFAVIIIIKHISNIKKLLRKEEKPMFKKAIFKGQKNISL